MAQAIDEPNLRLEEEVYPGDADYQSQPYVQAVCRQDLADRVVSVSSAVHSLHPSMCAEVLRGWELCVWLEISQATANAVCVYQRPACSTRELCQRMSDVGFGRPNAWWKLYEQGWQEKPEETQLAWLQHWGARLVEEPVHDDFVVRHNLELAEAHMRGFMRRVHVGPRQTRRADSPTTGGHRADTPTRQQQA